MFQLLVKLVFSLLVLAFAAAIALAYIDVHY